MSPYSEIKQVSFELLNIIDELVKPELTHAWARKLWEWFAMKRGKEIIINKPDEELKEKMKVSYDKMEKIFKKVEKADDLKEARDLNTGKMQRYVESIPENRAALDLIP